MNCLNKSCGGLRIRKLERLRDTLQDNFSLWATDLVFNRPQFYNTYKLNQVKFSARGDKLWPY